MPSTIPSLEDVLDAMEPELIKLQGCLEKLSLLASFHPEQISIKNKTTISINGGKQPFSEEKLFQINNRI